MPAMRSACAPELLAPAGGPEAAYAAFHNGADAVYCGLPRFSARADAENFTLDQLGSLTAFAHAQTPRRRVYVALNTLILQPELRGVVETLAALSDIGVDALIVQDLGVARLVREFFPELRLHASTQLTIHNRAGAAAARSFGFARVTLARELTLEEVQTIAALPGLEVEVFVHGALCYSYSGLCLFSSQLLGRSGNRGRCAQPCRAFYRVAEGSPLAGRCGFACSMKDLALPEHVAALREAGASSFKIEGRKKNALYVAAVTRFYRGLLDGTLGAAERARCAADIQTIFSRPWTRLFVVSRREQSGGEAGAPSHRGTPIGQVETVVCGSEGAAWLRFRSARALERHDGLQVELPGVGRLFGFAIEALRILEPVQKEGRKQSALPLPPPARGGGEQRRRRRETSRDVFEAPAGACVEVRLPESGFPPLPAGAAICCSSSQEVKRRYRFPKPKPGLFRAAREVDLRLEVTAHEIRVLGHAAPRSAGEEAVEACSAAPGAFAPARAARLQDAAARQVFEQLGGTRLALGRFEFQNAEARFVPLSKWKELRRAWTARMEMELAEAQARRVERVLGATKLSGAAAQPPEAERAGEGSCATAFLWSLKVDRLEFLTAFEREDWDGLDEVVVEIARDELPALSAGLAGLAARVGPARVRLALPILTRAWEEEDLRRRITALCALGWRKWEAANLSAWEFLELGRQEVCATDMLSRSEGLSVPSEDARMRPGQTTGPATSVARDVTTDWPVYVLNLASAQAVLASGPSRVTLSPEDGLANYRELLAELGARASVVVYQDTPLFLSETCAYASLRGGCQGPSRCPRPALKLHSGFGDSLVALTEHCRTVLLNEQPFCLAQHWRELRAAGAVRLRADFILRPYTAAAVRSRWRLIRSGHVPFASHAANFARGLL